MAIQGYKALFASVNGIVYYKREIMICFTPWGNWMSNARELWWYRWFDAEKKKLSRDVSPVVS